MPDPACLAHATGSGPYNSRDIAHDSWVGYVGWICGLDLCHIDPAQPLTTVAGELLRGTIVYRTYGKY